MRLIGAFLLTISLVALDGGPAAAQADLTYCIRNGLSGKNSGKVHEVKVTNLCDRTIDVSICFRTTRGGWDCGNSLVRARQSNTFRNWDSAGDYRYVACDPDWSGICTAR